MRKKAAKPRGTLSRDNIVAAAASLVEREGAAALSMRKLAEVLGVEAMSLYNHVEGKSDLMSAIADRILATVPLPEPSGQWRADAEALVLGLYDVLIAHPHAMLLLATEEAEATGPATLRLLECAAGILARSGLPPARQVNAFRGLIALCFGFVLTHTRGLTSTKSKSEVAWRRWNAAQWSNAGVPNLATLAPQFLKVHADDDLRFTLSAYLDALEAAAIGTKAARAGVRPRTAKAPNR